MGKTTEQNSFFSETYQGISLKIMRNPSVCTTVKNGIASSREICSACRKDFLDLSYDDALFYANFLSSKNSYATSIRKFRNLSALSAYLDKEKSSLGIPESFTPPITMEPFFQVFGRRTAKKFQEPGDMIGKTFGQLKAIRYAGKNERQENLYECECKCGGKRTVSEFLLIYGDVTDCGNSKKHPHGTDLLGQTFGFLKVIERDASDKNGQAKWLVRCGLCGKVTSISARNLLYGNTIACGCLRGKSRKYTEMLLENKEKYAVFW